MALYSLVDLAGTNGQSNFSFSFGYLDEADIHVYIDGVETFAFTFVSTYVIALNTPLSGAHTVRIQRLTPISANSVTFTNGSVLGQQDLNIESLQKLYADQEIQDQEVNNLGKNTLGQYDAGGNRIIDVGTPIQPTDAVTKAYVDSAYAASPAAHLLESHTDTDPALVHAKGDILAYDSVLGKWTKIAAGTDGQTLESDSSQNIGLSWQQGIRKLVTAAGDMIYASASGVFARIAAGAKGGLMVMNNTPLPSWLTVGADDTLLVADSTKTQGVDWKPISHFSMVGAKPSSTNLRGVWATTTTFTFTADVITLTNNSNQGVRVANGNVTNNISTAGPAANGRDQAGAFSNSSYIHFYWIYNGTTLATISSAVGPATGPTLPGGYTYWCYITTLPVNSTGTLNKHNVMGNMVHRDSWDLMGTLVSQTTVGENPYSSATCLPSIAVNAFFDSRLYAQCASPTSGTNVTFYFRAVSGGGSGWSIQTNPQAQCYVANVNTYVNYTFWAPALATYYAQLSDSGTIAGRNLVVYCIAYTVPNNS